MSLADYRDAVLTRFANPAVNDQLLRITSDGASKIPVFLGDTIRACLADGWRPPPARLACSRPSPAISAASTTGASRSTPLEPQLTAADRALAADPDPAAALRISAFKGLELERSPAFVASFVRYRALLAEQGTLATLAAIERTEGS